MLYMDRKRIKCLSNASQHNPSIFNHFWNIAIYRWRVIDFQQSREGNERFFYHILLSPGYVPGTIAVNITRLERGFNACQTPRYIYPSVFNRFWDIASYWSKIATFSYPTSPHGVTPSEFRKDLDTHKTRINGLSCGEESMQYVQPFWYNTSVWRTDGQTSSL